MEFDPSTKRWVVYRVQRENNEISWMISKEKKNSRVRVNLRGDVFEKVWNWEKDEKMSKGVAYVVVEKGNLRRREMKSEKGEVGI